MATAKAEGEEEAAAPKAGRSNLILIVIIAVLATILVSGGIAAIFLFKKSGPSQAQATEETADAPASNAASGKKEKPKKEDKIKNDGPKATAIYVALEPPFVVNFDATQTARFLQVSVQIMTRDSGMAQLIKENDPLVRNDLLLLFGGQEAAVIATREGKETLRKQTLETVRTLIKGEGGKPELVEAVYFTTFVMQ